MLYKVAIIDIKLDIFILIIPQSSDTFFSEFHIPKKKKLLVMFIKKIGKQSESGKFYYFK